jgi:DNA-binding response OmpR family regulator
MSRTKILVVEDSKSFNQMVTIMLEKYRYDISQAYTLKQALELLTADTYEYVLLDLNLPDAEGEFLIDSIMEFTSSKVIVMTADENTNQRDEYFQRGVIDYFIKTTPIHIIISNIHKLIKTIESYKDANILTIDDSSFVRNILKTVLTQKGYNVFTAASAQEGFDVLKDNRIDLILLDLIMPGMDGMKFLDKLKEDINYMDIPVVVISGDTSRNHYARVLKNGASDFIKKPFVVEEVLLKCDIHIKNYLQARKIVEAEKEIIKQQSISKLLENIAHHWRQPLSVISANASGAMIERKLGTETEEKFTDHMDNIIKFANLLSNTIEDFKMLFSNVLIKEELVFEMFFSDIIDDYQQYITRNEITVVKNIEVGTMTTYVSELRQIVSFLFNNIAEHAKENKFIFIDVRDMHTHIDVIIKDSGGGAPEDILDNLFEPYFTTEHQSFGKGLGLYIVYQIIAEEFNGKIEAKNLSYSHQGEFYKGLEFTISLPLKEY